MKNNARIIVQAVPQSNSQQEIRVKVIVCSGIRQFIDEVMVTCTGGTWSDGSGLGGWKLNYELSYTS